MVCVPVVPGVPAVACVPVVVYVRVAVAEWAARVTLGDFRVGCADALFPGRGVTCDCVSGCGESGVGLASEVVLATRSVPPPHAAMSRQIPAIAKSALPRV